MRTKILLPLTARTVLPSDPLLRQRVECLSAAVVRGRQAAEWGMRTLQGMFARLKSILPVDAHKRATILQVSFGLFNFQTRCGMVNHIRTSFSMEWTPGALGEDDWESHVNAWYNVE